MLGVAAPDERPAALRDTRLGREVAAHCAAYGLNESQTASVVKAVCGCAAPNAPKLSLTQGPPGTGKSTVIAHMVALMAGSCGKRVLATAPTNEAVKAVADSALRLLQRVAANGDAPLPYLIPQPRNSKADESSSEEDDSSSDEPDLSSEEDDSSSDEDEGVALPRPEGGAMLRIGDLAMYLSEEWVARLDVALKQLSVQDRAWRLFGVLNRQTGYQAALNELKALLQAAGSAPVAAESLRDACAQASAALLVWLFAVSRAFSPRVSCMFFVVLFMCRE